MGLISLKQVRGGEEIRSSVAAVGQKVDDALGVEYTVTLENTGGVPEGFVVTLVDPVNGGGSAAGKDFTGATATTPGTNGLVPAPKAGDQDRYLRGDGTWSTVHRVYPPIDAVPSQANVVVYTGAPVTCRWNDYDPEQLTIDGDFEAVSAGEYVVGFTPTADNVWADGTRERKTAVFTVGKAPGSLSLSAESGVVAVEDVTNFVVTAAGDGEVTVTVDDPGKATVVKNGNTVEVTGVSSGTVTVTVSQAEGSNHLAPASQAFTVTVNRKKVTVPTVTGTQKTYTGAEQSPTVVNEPSTTQATSAGKAATAVGDYAVVYTLTDVSRYEWSDGTDDPKVFPWTIGKAAGSLSLSANSGTVTVDETVSFVVTAVGDGAVTVTSGDPGTATARVNGSTVEVTGVSGGTTAITVSQAEGPNYLAPASQTFTVTVNKKRVTVPTVTDVQKVYTGGSQSPTVVDEPSAALATCAGRSAVNAGEYELAYTLVDPSKYEWADGTTAPKVFQWSIARANGTLTLSASSGSVEAGETITVEVTTDCDGEITATTADGSKATVSVSGKTVTITGVSPGNTVITISQAAGTNYNAPASVTYNVEVEVTEKELNNCTWQEISAIAQAGRGDLYFDIGDCKEITLNGKIGCLTFTNQRLYVFILDFNHPTNDVAENNIIFGGFKTALENGVDVALIDSYKDKSETNGAIRFNMNHWDTKTYGGWKGCDLRYDVLGATSTPPSDYGKEHTTSCEGYDATQATLNSPKADTLLAALPSDLRSVLKLWTRYVDAVGNGSDVDANIKPTVDAVTLLAEPEIFASRSYANQYEQNHNTRMAYYTNGNSSVKYAHYDPTDPVTWWESSPSSDFYNAGFCAVIFIGYPFSGSASVSWGLAPAFKV